jgi:hypothetical protein
MEHPGLEALRARLREHNRRVLALTLIAAGFAAALWAGLYFVVWWMFILAESIFAPVDFQPAAGPLIRGFIATAALLCAFAWVARLLRPNEAPRDHKSYGEHALDVVLAIPRATLAAFGTGGAAARLSDEEIRLAWNLLRKMKDRDSPVHVAELPVDIPNDAMRDRILLALQLCGIVAIRPSALGPVLGFQNEKARLLAEDRVRIRY